MKNMSEEGGGETRTADVKLYNLGRSRYAPSFPGAPVLNRMVDAANGWDKLMHKLKNPEIKISASEYPKLVQEARERVSVGTFPAASAESLRPLVTSEELAARDAAHRKELTGLRVSSIRMGLFFYPIQVDMDVVRDDKEKVVAFKNIRVQEPGELPSDEAVSRYLEAKRMQCQAESELAGVQHDVGAQRTMEGWEMKYRLAGDALSGTGQRPDLIPELLREEAKQFLAEQAKENRLANREKDPESSVMHQSSRQLDGAVSYIERLAESYEKRFNLK